MGQILVAYAQYQDRLVRVEGGQWRIKERNLVYMVSPKLFFNYLLLICLFESEWTDFGGAGIT